MEQKKENKHPSYFYLFWKRFTRRIITWTDSIGLTSKLHHINLGTPNNRQRIFLIETFHQSWNPNEDLEITPKWVISLADFCAYLFVIIVIIGLLLLIFWGAYLYVY